MITDAYGNPVDMLVADAPRRIWRRRCRCTTGLAKDQCYTRRTRCRVAKAELVHHVWKFCVKMSGETRERACCIEFEVEYILGRQGCACRK